MGYIRQTIISGKMMETIKTKKAERPRGRKEKRAATTEQQRAANKRRQEKTLARTIAANFGKGDIFATLTMREETDRKELQKMLAKFFRKLRRKHRDLRYILTDEYGGRSGKLHCHLVINRAVGLDDLTAAWEWGMVRAEAVYSDGDYRELARYLLKQERPDGERAWRGSRNLKKPVEKVEKVRAKQFRRKPPEEIKANGRVYRLDSYEEHDDPFTMDRVQYAVYFCREETGKRGRTTADSGCPPSRRAETERW